MRNTNKTLIIYHAPHCNDGFTAAWVTQRALEEGGHPTELYPMSYGEEQSADLLTFMENNYYRKIYIVDFSLPLDVLGELIKLTVANILILDHHKTAFEMYGYDMDTFNRQSSLTTTLYPGQVFIHLKNYQSGAGICWDYFYPGVPKVPALVKYVQDRDLWEYNYQETKAMHMFISSREKTIHEWDVMHAGLEDPEGHSAIVKLGEYLLDEYNQIVQLIASSAIACTIHGETGLMVQCEGQYSSDVGHLLAESSGTYGLCFNETADGESMSCSLRSEAGGDFDVEALAKSFGGGGHKSAAGFVVSLETMINKFSDTVTRKELNFND
jgi:oligoribonuclease NrnB/cAMP/cGMP phosphodiesterase (DHH superfamily)